MLLRFVAKNIFSFNDETEFNLFPGKTQGLRHHRIKVGEFDFLRFAAIYGANASGKSNLIKAILLIKNLVAAGKLCYDCERIKFRLNEKCRQSPISLAIELMTEEKAYYYSITFDNDKILHEYLAESTKKCDILIFERNLEEGKQKIKLFEAYYQSDKEKLFIEVLSDKILQKNELLITFLSEKYADEFQSVRRVFDFFNNDLVIINPDSKPQGIAHLIDSNPNIKKFANQYMASLSTGIEEILIEKLDYDEFIGKDDIKADIADNTFLRKLKENPASMLVVRNAKTKEDVSLVYENDNIIVKRLVTHHTGILGEKTAFNIYEESDGSKRLIDFIPAFQGIIHEKKVFIIDEIEHSLHPILIKELLKKLALDEHIKGQLIFSTHESNLLDNSILRPDEIWFAQKDISGASKFYSLSDFKMHNTLSIENGYLNGRFGGIPFLGNLTDLNWDNHEVSE